MSSTSKQTAPRQDEQPNQALPPWLQQTMRVCNAIYPFFLVITAVLLVTLVGLLAFKRLYLPWVPNVVGALGFFATLGVLAMLVAKIDSVIFPWVGTAVGFGLYYLPLLLGMLAARVGYDTSSMDLQNIDGSCRNIGFYTSALSIISLVVYYVRYFLNREKVQIKRFKYIDTSTKDTMKASLVPTCWQMSRCRPSVRQTCPNYIDRKTCWKRRSGCFCDKGLANYLISSSGRGEAQEAIDMQRAACTQQALGAVREQLSDKARRRPWKEQRRLCVNCPLYAEHQEYKYKHFSWLSFPITAIIAFSLYNVFDWAYANGINFLDNLVKSHLSNIPGTLSFRDSLVGNNSPFEYLLLAVLSLLLLSYIIGIMDKFFLEWQL